MPAHLELGKFPGVAHRRCTITAPARVRRSAQYIHSQWDPGLTWKDVEWLRSISPLPVIVKGILAPRDAVLSIENGAAP